MTRAALGPKKDSGVFLVGFMAKEADVEVGRGSKMSRLLLLARLAWEGIEEAMPPSPGEQRAETINACHWHKHNKLLEHDAYMSSHILR